MVKRKVKKEKKKRERKYYVQSNRNRDTSKVLANTILLGLENVGDAVFWWRAKKKRVAWVTRVSRSS